MGLLLSLGKVLYILWAYQNVRDVHLVHAMAMPPSSLLAF
jgi:hypothetical protein